MELQSLIQNLQNELRVMASLRRQEAEHTLTIAGLVGQIAYEAGHQSNAALKPIFPENDYGSIVSQINSNPTLIKKRKWQSESWPSYAVRLSKFVGWSVDARTLRTAFELHNKA